MERNPNSFNNFSNQSNTLGGFASNPTRSDCTSPSVWLNATQMLTGYDMNKQQTVEGSGSGSNQINGAPTYGGGQFGLSQRVHDLRRNGNPLMSFPEVWRPLLSARNDLPHSQPPAPVPVGGFTVQNVRNSLISSTDMSSTSSSASTNFLNRPIFQNPNVSVPSPNVLVSNQVAPLRNGCCRCRCRCPCYGNNTAATSSSHSHGLSQIPSHPLYPNNRSDQNPLKSNSTIDLFLGQRQASVNQGNVLSTAAPIPHLQTPNNNVNWGTSAAIVPNAEQVSLWLGKRKREEQVQANQNQQSGTRLTLMNENVGDQNNVSADARPVGINPVGNIFLGSDGRTHILPDQWKAFRVTCPGCILEFPLSQASAINVAAEECRQNEQRVQRTTCNNHGRGNHICHPSDGVTQVQPTPLFINQTSVPADQTKDNTTESSMLMNAGESSTANTANQGDPSQMAAVDVHEDLIDFLFGED